MAIIAPTSNDTELLLLMRDVDTGKIQLPDFQRGWTWDDNRIRGILASLSQGYPMGAIMTLQYGSESVRFKCRTIEGVKDKDVQPECLVLDGQQRLTSMYRAMFSKDPVEISIDKKKKIRRYYYLDMKMCLDDNADRLDAIVSVPEDRKVKKNFDRDVVLDLSTRELEFEHEMFPVNIIFDSSLYSDWEDDYREYHNYAQEYLKRISRFRKEVTETIKFYKLPVIRLDESTPREAICKVFENVNTGGVALTVFELVTASFATHEFDLREDWKACRNIIWGKDEPLNTDVMYGVDESAFLTTITLYTNYLAPTMTTCKRKDVLDLSYESYIASKAAILDGYKMARKFLFSQYVFRQRDLPYTTQLIPLVAICAVIGKTVFDQPRTQDILSQWFWCGIMGEMYGSSNESRYANDIDDVVAVIRGADVPIRTINASFFSATRLLSLQTRNSAAYKGIMALVYREQCRDFVKGTTMDIVKSMDEAPDIHHIFPEAYCVKRGLRREKWNSIVNKTPLLPASNRQIGGNAPSVYSRTILQKASIDEAQLRQRVESHLIDWDAFMRDDFDAYFADRAKKLLSTIEMAMGKQIADKGSEQTIRGFGCSLE